VFSGPVERWRGQWGVGWGGGTVDAMNRPGRLTQLRIAGMRVIEDLTLDLEGLTVLIGDNGTGKSTILEAIELLRQTTSMVSFGQDIITRHGGFQALLRRGSETLSLGCRVREPDGTELDYDLRLGGTGHIPIIIGETASVVGTNERYSRGERFKELGSNIEAPGQWAGIQQVALSTAVLPPLFQHPVLDRIRRIVEHFSVHVPFETRPLWQLKDLDIRESPRLPSPIEPTNRLARYATNLPNAFQELRNRGGDIWSRVVERARIGIHQDIRDFRISAASRGHIELEVVLGTAPDKPMPIEYLSEGQISFLAMLALCELSDQSTALALDEPELHLHPALLVRVVMLLEDLAENIPIVLSTHSDQLLDCVSHPASSVVLCDLDERGAARLRRPNREALAQWLERYRGVGSVRAEGSLEQLFDE
jgi:predicted ATPase